MRKCVVMWNDCIDSSVVEVVISCEDDHIGRSYLLVEEKKEERRRERGDGRNTQTIIISREEEAPNQNILLQEIN